MTTHTFYVSSPRGTIQLTVWYYENEVVARIYRRL